MRRLVIQSQLNHKTITDQLQFSCTFLITGTFCIAATTSLPLLPTTPMTLNHGFELSDSSPMSRGRADFSSLLADRSFMSSYPDFRPSGEQALQGDQVVFSNAFSPQGAIAAPSEPLLNSTTRDQITRADSLNISSAADNQASGKQPDYRVVEGADGSLVLEKVGSGDPLADGELNIEIDTHGKSLQEAILQNDKSLKEYYRELIAAWRQNHPDKDFPGWWQDIINAEPRIPTDAQPVPIREASARTPVQPQERQVEPRQSSGGATGGGGLPFPFGGAGGGGGDGSGAGYDSGGAYRSGSDNSGQASSGAVPSADQQTVLNNVRTVVEVAQRVGVDPQLAVAMMLVESGGDNRAVGDNGTSFGLFQLHQGGMLTEAHLSREQAFDPRTNAEVSLSHLARIDDRYPNNPGQAAAASQRPAHPEQYAQRVNNSMDEAAELIATANQSVSSQTTAHGNTRTNTG